MYPLFQNAHQLFVKIIPRNSIFRNSLLSLYYSSLCNNYAYREDSVEVFNEKQNVISWTSRISTLVRKNEPEEALIVFKTMLLKDQRPNYVTVLSVIRAVGLLDREDMAWGVHGLVIKMGLALEEAVVTALIGIYSVFHMENVWRLFDGIPSKDVVLWSAMISACVKNGECVEALELFRMMQCYGVESNYVTVISILPACADLGALSFGEQVHGLSIKRMFYPHTNVQNSLLDMYAKCRNFEASIRVFYDNRKKDLISWKTVLRACILNEFPVEAINTFFMLRGSCFEPTETIILDTIGAFIQVEQLRFGEAFHCYILKSGFLAFVSIGTAVLQMYAKFGVVDSARILFDQLRKKDLIAWSAMISAYAQNGHPLDALNTFKHMQSTYEKPNEITFVSLLQACSSAGAQEQGQSIHAHTIKSGYLFNTFITSALIDLYCKFGRINSGTALFDETPTKDLICWSSMINGYGLNGCGSEALVTFSNMLDCGIKPNDIIFISVLSACSHCGLEYEGWNWFYAMEERYGITPKLAHYACMVDLLSRRGNMEEALAFINKMPVEPDKRIWGALLAGCRLRPGTIKIAELVAERLMGLDPENTSYYVILSNLYTDEGRWADAERLRNLVNEKGLKKTKGWSLIEAN